VRFDVTRQADVKAWIDGGPVVMPSRPSEEERANDDLNTDDESFPPNNVGEMYAFDAPGPRSDNALGNVMIYRGNFWEFVRVRFDSLTPAGNVIAGSRASDKFEWHARHWLTKNAHGKWVRKDGSQETDDNDVGLGLITIGDQP